MYIDHIYILGSFMNGVSPTRAVSQRRTPCGMLGTSIFVDTSKRRPTTMAYDFDDIFHVSMVAIVVVVTQLAQLV